jgi:uncharacterized membrane protein
MNVALAHIAGVPLEETLLAFGPALLASGGYFLAVIRSRLGR